MRPCHTRASSSLIIERQTVSNASCASQYSPWLKRSRACSRWRRRSPAAICCRPSAISDPEQVNCAVTARDGADQHFGALAARARLLDELVTRADRIGCEHPDAEDLVFAHEQRGPLHR